MFRIGEFSKLSNITIKMLRHYDTIDLLKPEIIDNSSSYRYYSAEQLGIANQINLYKSMGFSLKEIKLIIYSDEKGEKLQNYFDTKEQELLEELTMMKKRVKLLEKINQKNKQDQEVQYHAIKKMIPQRLVISLRKKVADYDDEKNLWNELYQTIEKYQLKPKYDGYTMTVYHDREYQEEQADIEVQVTIQEEKSILGECKIQLTDELTVISVTFAGSYQQMPKVNQTLAFWLAHEKEQLAGPMINIFHVSPAQTRNEQEYVTEACYIIKSQRKDD